MKSLEYFISNVTGKHLRQPRNDIYDILLYEKFNDITIKEVAFSKRHTQYDIHLSYSKSYVFNLAASLEQNKKKFLNLNSFSRF